MEDTFYDGDLKDIWDSDLDPAESLKISSDHDMHDWFLDRDVKNATVILNDKLISDALLNGTLPIKTEHSYSLNSDSDSLPDSPRSLQAKIDDMDDECYPAISLKTVTSVRATIDPKCLTLHPPVTNSRLTPATANGTAQDAVTISAHGGCISLDSLKAHNNSSSVTVALEHFHLPQHLAAMYDNDCSSSVSSAREGSLSPDICSDIEIDEAAIKDEPMSPDSSCPASPKSLSSMQQHATALSLNLANLQTELLFEQKHGSLLFTNTNTSNTQNLIKSQQQQQVLMGNGSQNLMLSKIAIKSERQNAGTSLLTTGKVHANGGAGAAYGIPLTPPSSLPSDDSEGNSTPEHLFSPMSPNASVSISVATTAAANGSPSAAESATATTVRRSGGIHSAVVRHASGNAAVAGAGGTTTSTRQPIHTPLISSQPKGSTGTLLLTEEEKRTLLAEGYPIPQKLPLTKAEEKSLKKIRRKIKNKISAQESRRKKKEYMDQLERRVEILVTENHDYKKRIESLEETNTNLLSQLQKLQALVNKHNVKKS